MGSFSGSSRRCSGRGVPESVGKKGSARRVGANHHPPARISRAVFSRVAHGDPRASLAPASTPPHPGPGLMKIQAFTTAALLPVSLRGHRVSS